jgi:putative peptidoglycan lipid II flippase
VQAPVETLNRDPQPAFRRFLKLFRPSHQHTARSATVLLATTILLSRLVGFLREMYIAWAFGATSVTDAYNAGFTIPDWVNYLAAGGTASITNTVSFSTKTIPT